MKRYGISEWYGQPFLTLTPQKRQEFAGMALGTTAPPKCPFRGINCNKKGGVCSIRPYKNEKDRISCPDGEMVITCPNRFEQNKLLALWLAEIAGFDAEQKPLIAREIPFMLGTTTGKPAGKIDLVVACDRHELIWLGLEIQAVYFSGPGMESEFHTLLEDKASCPPFPNAVRRPDWRSSSAKRLMPQLQIKGPTLRRWHSKLAVAVDRPFFEAIGGPSNKASKDINAGDVIWLVPQLSESHRLERGYWEVLTLEDSANKLLSAEAVSRRDFEHILRRKLKPL